jgi:glycosyltransferase involved in cell wall biosynthesis
VFVTQNGDWPAFARNSEYRFFSCDGLICTNPDFYARNKERWPSVLIPNGVDRKRFNPGPGQRTMFGLPPDKTIVLMVSALIESKRVLTGIEAVSSLKNVHLVVAGDGPLRSAVEELAAHRLGKRFTLLSVTPDQMPTLYRSSDLFLHLSREEAFGNVYLEAMACGLPIIAHDSARVRWIVGDNQYLINTDIVSEISAAIQTVRTSIHPSPSEVASKFSWNEIATRYSEFFHEISC